MKKLNQLCLLIMICTICLSANAQTGITLEGLWKDYSFSPNYVAGFNFMQDGVSYTKLKDDQIQRYNLTTGQQEEVLFDGANFKGQLGFDGGINGYHFNHDESKMIIETEASSIYRRSYIAEYHIYDRASKEISAVFEDGKVQYCTLSPDGKKAAYVYQNDVYYLDLENGETYSVTDDGKQNSIINGAADWVYEEEFGFAKAFFWSPDGSKIAYIRFDETEVKEFTMTNYKDGVYPEYVTFKYPKVGEKNAIVSVHIFDLKSENTTKVNIGTDESYIPRIKWTPDPNKLIVFKMNRHQSHLELLLADAKNGKTSVMMEEKNKYYIDIHDHMHFLENGKEFIWTSEKDGFNHVYLFNTKGKEVKQITKGNFDVTSFYGVDEKISVPSILHLHTQFMIVI